VVWPEGDLVGGGEGIADLLLGVLQAALKGNVKHLQAPLEPHHALGGSVEALSLLALNNLLQGGILLRVRLEPGLNFLKRKGREYLDHPDWGKAGEEDHEMQAVPQCFRSCRT